MLSAGAAAALAAAGLAWATTTTAGAVSGPFGTPIVVSAPGINSGEPGIDVASDSTLYINAPDGLLSSTPGSPSYVWRSADAGATWVLTPPGARANLPGGGDSDIAIDQHDGTVYMTDLWLGSSTVAVSHDKANTWTANPVQGTVVQDRQWVGTSGGGIAYHVTHQIPSGLVVSKSVDGGISYPISSVAATPADQTGCVCPPGNLVVEGTGALLGSSDKVGVIYYTSTGGINFAWSTNGAASFTQAAVSPASSADTGRAFPVVADAGNGHLVAVWLETFSSSNRVMINSSSNFGQTWGTPHVLVGTGTSVYPWVDASGSKISVSLYHNSSSATADTTAAGVPWFESYLESNDAGTTWSALTTVDPTAVKTGPICTQGTNCSANRELLDFQQVVIDPLGRANVTYTRSVDNVSTTQIRFDRQT